MSANAFQRKSHHRPNLRYSTRETTRRPISFTRNWDSRTSPVPDITMSFNEDQSLFSPAKRDAEPYSVFTSSPVAGQMLTEENSEATSVSETNPGAVDTDMAPPPSRLDRPTLTEDLQHTGTKLVAEGQNSEADSSEMMTSQGSSQQGSQSFSQNPLAAKLRYTRRPTTKRTVTFIRNWDSRVSPVAELSASFIDQDGNHTEPYVSDGINPSMPLSLYVTRNPVAICSPAARTQPLGDVEEEEEAEEEEYETEETHGDRRESEAETEMSYGGGGGGDDGRSGVKRPEPSPGRWKATGRHPLSDVTDSGDTSDPRADPPSDAARYEGHGRSDGDIAARDALCRQEHDLSDRGTMGGGEQRRHQGHNNSRRPGDGSPGNDDNGRRSLVADVDRGTHGDVRYEDHEVSRRRTYRQDSVELEDVELDGCDEDPYPLPAHQSRQQVDDSEPLPAQHPQQQVDNSEPLPAHHPQQQVENSEPLSAHHPQQQVDDSEPLSVHHPQQQVDDSVPTRPASSEGLGVCVTNNARSDSPAARTRQPARDRTSNSSLAIPSNRSADNSGDGPRQDEEEEEAPPFPDGDPVTEGRRPAAAATVGKEGASPPLGGSSTSSLLEEAQEADRRSALPVPGSPLSHTLPAVDTSFADDEGSSPPARGRSGHTAGRPSDGRRTTATRMPKGGGQPPAGRGRAESTPRALATPRSRTESTPRALATPRGTTQSTPRALATPRGRTESTLRALATPRGKTESTPRALATPRGKTESTPRALANPVGKGANKAKGTRNLPLSRTLFAGAVVPAASRPTDATPMGQRGRTPGARCSISNSMGLVTPKTVKVSRQGRKRKGSPIVAEPARSDSEDLEVRLWVGDGHKRRKASDVTDLDILLNVFEDQAIDFRHTLKSKTCTRALNAFAKNMQKDLREAITLAAQVMQLQTSVNGTRNRIRKKRTELLATQKMCFELERELHIMSGDHVTSQTARTGS